MVVIFLLDTRKDELVCNNCTSIIARRTTFVLKFSMVDKPIDQWSNETKREWLRMENGEVLCEWEKVLVLERRVTQQRNAKMEKWDRVMMTTSYNCFTVVYGVSRRHSAEYSSIITATNKQCRLCEKLLHQEVYFAR